MANEKKPLFYPGICDEFTKRANEAFKNRKILEYGLRAKIALAHQMQINSSDRSGEK